MEKWLGCCGLRLASVQLASEQVAASWMKSVFSNGSPAVCWKSNTCDSDGVCASSYGGLQGEEWGELSGVREAH